MKKLLMLAAVVVLFAGGCCSKCKAEDLINYVPADVDGVISVDAARMAKLSHLQDLRKEDKQVDEGWTEFEKELAKYGLTINDLPSRIMVFFKSDGNTQNAGILALTKISEEKFLELIKKSEAVSCTEKTIDGRKAYVINQKDVPENTAVVSYIKPDLALICDDDKAEELFKQVGKSKNAKLIAADKKADHEALMYLLYSKTKENQPAATAPDGSAMPPMNANPLDSLEAAVVTLNLSGKTQKDVSMKADIDCCDAPNAVQLAAQLKTMVMIMTMQMAQNPGLSKAVTEAVSVDQKDKNIKIDVSISEKLIEDIKTHVQNQNKQSIAPAPIPATESQCCGGDAASEEPAKKSPEATASEKPVKASPEKAAPAAETK